MMQHGQPPMPYPSQYPGSNGYHEQYHPPSNPYSSAPANHISAPGYNPGVPNSALHRSATSYFSSTPSVSVPTQLPPPRPARPPDAMPNYLLYDGPASTSTSEHSSTGSSMYHSAASLHSSLQPVVTSLPSLDTSGRNIWFGDPGTSVNTRMSGSSREHMPDEFGTALSTPSIDSGTDEVFPGGSRLSVLERDYASSFSNMGSAYSSQINTPDGVRSAQESDASLQRDSPISANSGSEYYHQQYLPYNETPRVPSGPREPFEGFQQSYPGRS